MLVLSRKSGEQIVLPQCEVTLTVLGVSGSRVRIGIAAPDGTAVHRREIWDKIVASPPKAVTEHCLQRCE
ncbi:MAG TPA: carbon storage regulator [Candidatus Anammoximicrobium sp.]|nr:carbon storage regulator [Candidatus Anammoximicrobium sp.]